MLRNKVLKRMSYFNLFIFLARKIEVVMEKRKGAKSDMEWEGRKGTGVTSAGKKRDVPRAAKVGSLDRIIRPLHCASERRMYRATRHRTRAEHIKATSVIEESKPFDLSDISFAEPRAVRGYSRSKYGIGGSASGGWRGGVVRL